MLVEHRFRAMNTDIGVWLWSTSPAADSLLHEVEQLFADVEEQLSRFHADSELSRLNTQAGKGATAISPLLATVLAQALKAARKTDGVFDPTVLHVLCQAGYDRSFENIGRNGVAQNNRPQANVTAADWRQVEFDAVDRWVRLPAGLGIDLGGIAKGWTVDQAIQLAQTWGAALVDAGGDMRAVGRPGGEAWPVAVQDPFDETGELMTLALTDCAVATSSIGRRCWQRDGERVHHIIDPRAGQASASDLHTVTVLAQTATEAEVAAKTALILGGREGAAYLRRAGYAGLLTQRNGSRQIIGPIPQIEVTRDYTD